MPQSCLLPLLGLVASAQRVDDRHRHETAWDRVDRACTVVIDARKVTLRRTGDAAGPRLCAKRAEGTEKRKEKREDRGEEREVSCSSIAFL